MTKIKNKVALKRILSGCRRKKIVFTNGCFDLIHIGHVKYLRKARALGDVLVVGLNSDSSLRKLKGKGRPIIGEKERAELLSSFYFVDYVVIFGESTPAEIIKFLKPDILVKGADYKLDNIVGRDTVGGYGGIVKTIPLVKNKSTTNLIQKIKRIK